MKIGTILSLSLIFIMGKAWASCDTVNSNEPFTKLRGGGLPYNPYYIFFCRSKPAVSHQLTAGDIGTGFKGDTNSRLLGRSVSSSTGSGDGSLSAIPGTEIDLNGNLDENDLSFLYDKKKIVLSDTPVFNFYSRIWPNWASCGTATTREYKYITNYIKGSEGLPFFYSPNTGPDNLFFPDSGSVGVNTEGDGLIRIKDIQLKSGTNILEGDLIFHIVDRPPIVHGSYRFCRIGLGAKLEINPKGFLNTNTLPGNYTVEVKVKKP